MPPVFQQWNPETDVLGRVKIAILVIVAIVLLLAFFGIIPPGCSSQ